MKRLGLASLLLCVVILVTKLFAHPTLNDFVTVYTDTDGGGLTGDYSGLVITNPAATGAQTFHLPPAVKGMHFIFALSAAQKIVLNPQDNNVFIGTGISPAPADGDAIESDQVIGTLIEIVAVDATNWLTIRKVGTWIDIDNP
jgi:hypothetical protein